LFFSVYLARKQRPRAPLVPKFLRFYSALNRLNRNVSEFAGWPEMPAAASTSARGRCEGKGWQLGG
jgi:hypothetical protein